MLVPPKVKQVFYSLSALLNLLIMGMTFGFPALLTPALLRGDILTATIDEATWIVSTPGISGMLFGVLIGPLMHYFGRRKPHIATNILVLIGWILTSLAKSIWVLSLGTALQGLTTGLISFYSIIIAEFTCPKIRGLVLLLKLVCVSSGIFIIHGLGYLVHWQTAALIPLAPVLLSILIAILSPETPDWLITMNRFDEAEQVFYNLRGHSKDSEWEIKKSIEAKKKKAGNRGQSSYCDVAKKLRAKALWRPITLLFCCIVVPEAGGRHFFPAYPLQLAEEITGDKSKGYFYTMALDLISTFCSVTSCFLIKIFSRRCLVVKCGYAASAVYFVSCVLMYVRSNFSDSTTLMYASVVLLAIYVMIMYLTTFGTCYVILGELLPLEYRAVGLVFNGVLSALGSSMFLKLLPIFRNWFGVHGMLGAFCGIMLLCLIYMDYDLPETRNRTLYDIGEYFSGKSPKIRKESELLWEILARKWGWLGHTLRRPDQHPSKQGLMWQPPGKRKAGRPKTTWRRSVTQEVASIGLKWGELEAIAQDRNKWRSLIKALCPC